MNRDELEEQLRPLIFSCPSTPSGTCPFSGCTSCDERMAKAMALIDTYADASVPLVETWTAKQVADFLGYRSAAGARTTLSRWGIKRVCQDTEENGRPMAAFYPADEIRAEAAKRGHRRCTTNVPS